MPFPSPQSTKPETVSSMDEVPRRPRSSRASFDGAFASKIIGAPMFGISSGLPSIRFNPDVIFFAACNERLLCPKIMKYELTSSPPPCANAFPLIVTR